MDPRLLLAVLTPRRVQDTLWRSAKAVPSLDVRFGDGSAVNVVTGSPGVFTRPASAKNVFLNGVLTTYAADQIAFTEHPVTGRKGASFEKASLNRIANNTNIGAAVGTPGTEPTGWTGRATSVLTVHVVGAGTIGAMPYIDYRCSGTATQTTFSISFSSTVAIVAATGETLTLSAWVGLLDSTVTPPISTRLQMNERRSNGSNLATLSSFYIYPADYESAAQVPSKRYEFTRTLSNAETVRVQPSISFDLQIGATYDFTVRIAGVQLEQQPKATSLILCPNVATARAADNLTFTGVDIGTQGTIYVEYTPQALESGTAIALHDTTSNNLVEVGVASTGATLAGITAGAVAQSAFSQSSTGTGRTRVAALSYTADDVKLSSYDNALEIDASATIPATTTIEIGSKLAAASINGIVHRVALFSNPISEATLPALAPRRRLNVFLVGGQSNANGWHNVNTTPAAFLGGTPVVPGVTAWNGSVLRPYDKTTSGVNGDGRDWTTSTGWNSPSFAHIALSLLSDKIDDVVSCWVTQNGAFLNNVSSGNGSWNSNYASIPEGTARLAEALQLRYQSLVAYCAANDIELKLRGLIWHQGEADTSSPNQEAYAANFTALIASIRAYTNNPSLPIFYGTTVNTRSAIVRAALLDFAASDANAWCRNNDDLPTTLDGLHFDPPGYNKFGKWVADTYLANYLNTDVPPPIFIPPSARDEALALASPDALAWILAREAADGAEHDTAILAPLIEFANWRFPFGGYCSFPLGATSLDGGKIPLVGTGTYVGLAGGDYTQSGGVKSDGTTGTKYIDSGVASSSLSGDDAFVGMYVTEANTLSSFRSYAGQNSATSDFYVAALQGTDMRFRFKDKNQLIQAATGGIAGFIGVGRVGAALGDGRARVGGTTYTGGSAAATPSSNTIYFMTRNNDGTPNSAGVDSRFSCVSVSPGLGSKATFLEELDTRMTAATLAIQAALA